MASFTDYSLLPSLIGTLKEQGIETPTEIQAATIPAQLKGRSVIGVAETGSGKTLAYVLPVLHQLKVLETEGAPVSITGRPRALVLVPGRELGQQVVKVFKGLTHDTRLRVRSCLGGTKKQIARQNVGGLFEVLVATPGRLTQFLDQKQLRLDGLRVLVLDEADQLLDPTFIGLVGRALGASPPDMRVALFGATISTGLETAALELFPTEPVRVRTDASRRALDTLTTENLTVRDQRVDVLRKVLAKDSQTSTLLFANTRKQCEKLSTWLTAEGHDHVTYMGEMESSERRANLARFRAGEVKLLVATDLAGRGLDIERVDRVINAHLPRDIDNYRHRVGRTARAGREGLVVNLVTQRDKPLLDKLDERERKTRKRPS